MTDTDKLKSGIYKITCLINKKRYIGSAINLNDRKAQHFYKLKNNVHGNKHLQASFNKHGKPNFYFDVIEFVDKSSLIDREQFWIDTIKPEYNQRKVAKSNLGITVSSETRNKLSIAHKGKTNTGMFKKGNIPWSLGKKLPPVSEKQKEITSKLFKGVSKSADHRLKISESLKGKIRSAEHSKKISLSKVGKSSYIRTADHKHKMSLIIKEIKLNTSKK